MAGPQLWTTGPVDTFVGIGGGQLSKSPLFLCHGEDAPDVQHVRYRKPVRTDQSGGRSGPPADFFALGSDALITVTAARHDMGAVITLLCEPSPFGANAGVPFVQKAGDRGSLLVAENLTFPLWLRWEYATKAAMLGSPVGLHFFACSVLGPDRVHSGMGELTEFSYVFYAHSVQLSQGSPGQWNCGDFDMSAVAGFPFP